MRPYRQLILNPVENLPYLITDKPLTELHGLYVSDKEKTDDSMKKSKIAFSGRQEENETVRAIYGAWAEALSVRHFSMRLLSGLHAHIIVFMGLGKIGDTVMLLPEEAGGHYATKKILNRLGYHVIEMVPDDKNLRVDIEATRKILLREKPKFLFVDRSEGIHYEDFSPLLRDKDELGFEAVFDGSQYLTNILNGDFPSPFDMGFDIMLSTLHKNFPGPQKALVCGRENSSAWDRIQEAMSDYVSSLHVETTYLAGDILAQRSLLQVYSKRMLENSVELEQALQDHGLPVVCKDPALQATHHIWVAVNDRDRAYAFFKRMEACGILANYRKLPYHLGMGIRMGTSAATLQGLKHENIVPLAQLIAALYHGQVTDKLFEECQQYIAALRPLAPADCVNMSDTKQPFAITGQQRDNTV